MDTVPQDAFATLGLAEEGGAGLTGLARALLEAGVNEMMAARADAVCEATGTARNGFRERRLETQVGTITLRIPKLRRGTHFPDGLVERWSRVGRAVICAVAEMHAPGVSTRKVGKALERMGADRLSKDAVSRICAALDAEVADLRSRQLPAMRYPYPWVDATYVPCRKNGHGATAAVVTAIAVGEDGVRRVVGLACVDAESYASWKGFLRGLRERGLSGVQCVTSDAHGGIVRAVRELFPGAAWQRCVVHLERDVVDACPHALEEGRGGTRPARRARRGRPGEGARPLPGRVRRHRVPVGRRREGHGEGRGRRPRLPRLPGGAPPPHQDQQRPGVLQPRDQAPRARGPELPVGGGAGPPGGRGVLRGVRGLVQPQVHGTLGDRGAVGARDRARPGADRGAGLEGALEDRGALRA